MNQFTMEGYIERLAGGFSGWEKEYAEVKNDEFRYYKDKGKKLKGIIPLSGTKLEVAASDPMRVTIELPNKETIHLRFKDMTNKIDWVNALSIGNQDSEYESSQKKELFESEEFKRVRSELADLLKLRILANSSKLTAFVTQVWTLQGLLEGTLSDFSEDLSKIVSPKESLKENAEKIKTYTAELKVKIKSNI